MIQYDLNDDEKAKLQSIIDNHPMIKFLKKFPSTTKMRDIPDNKIPNDVMDIYVNEQFRTWKDYHGLPNGDDLIEQDLENLTVGYLLTIQGAEKIITEKFKQDKAYAVQKEENRKLNNNKPANDIQKQRLMQYKSVLGDQMPDFDLQTITNGNAKAMIKKFKKRAKAEQKQQSKLKRKAANKANQTS